MPAEQNQDSEGGECSGENQWTLKPGWLHGCFHTPQTQRTAEQEGSLEVDQLNLH